MMFMTVQEWIVAAIALFCAIEMGRRIWRFFQHAKNDHNPCANCVGGCDLKRMLDEKQQKCRENQKKKDKNSCS